MKFYRDSSVRDSLKRNVLIGPECTLQGTTGTTVTVKVNSIRSRTEPDR